VKVYIFAITSVLYGCRVWILKQRDIKRLKTGEMIFMRWTEEYSLLEQRRNDIFEKLKVYPSKNKLSQYKQKWLNHVSRMENIRCLKQLLDFQPVRRPGQPLDYQTDTIMGPE